MQGVCPFAFHRGPLSAVCLRYFWWTDCSWGLDSVQVFLLPPFLLSFQHHYVATAHERRVSLYFFGTRSRFSGSSSLLLQFLTPSLLSASIIQSSQSRFGRPVLLWPQESADRCRLAVTPSTSLRRSQANSTVINPLTLHINKSVIRSPDGWSGCRPQFHVDSLTPT